MASRLRSMDTPAYQLAWVSDPQLALYAETFIRECWRIGEGLECVGVYVGPRRGWVAFVSPRDREHTLAKADFERRELDEWIAAR